MRILIARIFRVLFKISFFKKYFYGFHKKLFSPFNLFRDITQKVKFQNEINLILHIDDWIQENLYFLGEYEKAELILLKKILKKENVFIDLGANIGLFSLLASKQVGEKGQIISFEPFSKNYKSLSKNISINNFRNIKAENLAVGEKNKVINLYYNNVEKNLGMVSTLFTEYSDKETVECVSLDNYFSEYSIKKVDFIKIDIEGYEYSALIGMKNILLKFHPTLLIEILNDDKFPNNKKIINDFLKSIGYKKYFIDDNGNLSEAERNPSRLNYLFSKTFANNS